MEKKSILDNFEKKLEKAKEILPSTFRIGETIFTSMAVIGGKLYSSQPKNLNHVHKDTNLCFLLLYLWLKI